MSDILTENVISRNDCIFCARHNCTPISNKMIRATCDALADAEARVEQLATALKTYGYRRHYTCEDAFYSCPKSGERYDTVEGAEQECTCGADQHNAKVDAALTATAAATQADERAAAERELLDRLTKRILAEIVYCAPENRALAEEVARVAKIETDLILARHDAMPKERT